MSTIDHNKATSTVCDCGGLDCFTGFSGYTPEQRAAILERSAEVSRLYAIQLWQAAGLLALDNWIASERVM